MVTENGMMNLISEDHTSPANVNIANEISNPIDTTTTMIGLQSGVEFTFLEMNRANVIVSNGAYLSEDGVFNSDNGFLSYPQIQLHDGYNVQDYSYTIKTYSSDITSISSTGELQTVNMLLMPTDYRNIVKMLVHPAGFRMLGTGIIYNAVKVYNQSSNIILTTDNTTFSINFTMPYVIYEVGLYTDKKIQVDATYESLNVFT